MENIDITEQSQVKGKSGKMYETAGEMELAIAVSVIKKGADKELLADYFHELKELAETAGAEIVETLYQELAKPNPATAIGCGKVEELKQLANDLKVHLVIFDDDLSPAQTKNLGEALGIKVIDRSGLILDIFAKRARTVEAKTQVRLAQLQYMLPRLTRMWTHLSKQFGGIGTNMKGPGETQIETDRRIIKEQIQRLKEDLVSIGVQKEQQRRSRSDIPKFALVGYTNAGKSTLMNTVTEASCYVEDKLFATLDTTVRAFELPGGQNAVLSDTVGFIRKLPHHLVASFRSTLAEAKEADVIVHIVDASHKLFRDHIKVVNATLESLGISNKPVILVLNKIDKIEDGEIRHALIEEFPGAVPVSAKKIYNIATLIDVMRQRYEENVKFTKLLLPYADMRFISQIYSLSRVLKREDTDDGIILELVINKDKDQLFAYNFEKFEVKQWQK